ncbi:MAG: hypothetical protein JXP34_24545 [Planctomycetes bacterium]|nr:hypothetical protein [Planctomycetota bacterium]
MAETSFSGKAKLQGVERPFEILRSMGTHVRERLAELLGLRIPPEKRGDPDAESWIIINRDRRGLQARTHLLPETISPFARCNNWWEILSRTARWLVIRFYPGVSEYAVERMILERTAQLAVSELPKDEVSSLDELAGRLSGFRMTMATLELSEDAMRLILAALWRAYRQAGEGTREGVAQAAAWINEKIQAHGFMPTITRGLQFLRESMDKMYDYWEDLCLKGCRRGTRVRKLALAISTIHLQDILERGLCEHETTRT